jgi:hypothetical protein
MRRVPAIEAAIVKSREEKAYSDVYSEVLKNTRDRLTEKQSSVATIQSGRGK